MTTHFDYKTELAEEQQQQQIKKNKSKEKITTSVKCKKLMSTPECEPFQINGCWAECSMNLEAWSRMCVGAVNPKQK